MQRAADFPHCRPPSCIPAIATVLLGALEAPRAGLIDPILVGPEAKIRSVAAAEGIDLTGIRIVDVRARHAAAAKAVAAGPRRQGRGADEGQPAHRRTDARGRAPRARGLRTERRISHAYVMDVPTYPQAADHHRRRDQYRPDARGQARHRARTPSIWRTRWASPQPKVAILSAVETVTAQMPSTLDAAALCKMADRGQITGGMLDGPLAFDNAISAEAAARPRASSRRSPARPTSCSCRTSRPATCWPSS